MHQTRVVADHPAGQGEKVLGQLREAGVNLLGYSGFPGKARKAQLELIRAGGPMRVLATVAGPVDP